MLLFLQTESDGRVVTHMLFPGYVVKRSGICAQCWLERTQKWWTKFGQEEKGRLPYIPPTCPPGLSSRFVLLACLPVSSSCLFLPACPSGLSSRLVLPACVVPACICDLFTVIIKTVACCFRAHCHYVAAHIGVIPANYSYTAPECRQIEYRLA